MKNTLRLRARWIWPLVWTCLVASGCGGQLLVDSCGPEEHRDAAAETAGTGGAASGGASGSSASGGGAGAAGDASSGRTAHAPDAGADAAPFEGSSGGAVGTGGEGSVLRDAGHASGASGNGDASTACTLDADCPPPDRNCAVSRCNAGRCEVVNAPPAATIPDAPADCHASICDGAGNATGVVVDQTNLPVQASPCVVGTCDASGKPGTALLPAGTACSAGPRTVMCDGAGHCVECNHTTDCAPGLYCDANHLCGSAPCTDLDCGGACTPCDLGKHCIVDADCQSYACDASTGACIQNQCLDHRQDGNETDADCGGGICQGCELGQVCLLDLDCKSQACDVVTLKCVLSQCTDHRLDGAETDVDCGGGGCAACAPGQKCKSNFDCVSGHFCNGSKVCQ